MALVLVVDDNEMNRDMLSRRLSRHGHQVLCAKDGAEALALQEANPIDLIFLDVMMPGVSGLEVLRQVRQRKRPTELPVIMVTAKDQSQDVVAAMEMGANDYLSKPIDFAVLLARMGIHLEVLAQSKASKNLVDFARGHMRPALEELDRAVKRLHAAAAAANVSAEVKAAINDVTEQTQVSQQAYEGLVIFGDEVFGPEPARNAKGRSK
jgi:DNA-binding response OmpR family regulator